MDQKILVLGAGGHGRVLVSTLLMQGKTINRILEIDNTHTGKQLLGIPIEGPEEEILLQYSPEDVLLVNAIGSINLPKHRTFVYQKYKNINYSFLSIIHNSAIIGMDVSIDEGSQIMAGAIVQSGSKIGKNVIINTRASVDHDVKVGDHVHIAPGVTCCGNVMIGKGSHIGSGAVILQGITIGENCLIGAGAVVVSNINDDTKVKGIPAKAMD